MTHKKFIQYWEEYYKKHQDPSGPSPFALDISKYLESGKELIDLGCGNGRDSVFFAQNSNLNVTAVDQSAGEIAYLNSKYGGKNLQFIADDFTKLKINRNFDYIYSRFTLHSVNKNSESKTLKWSYNHLNNSGLLLIEVRGVKDTLFGKGKKVARNSFVTDHFRRFVVFQELLDELNELKFEIIHSVESDGLAVYNDENPIVIRVIAQKVEK